MARDLGEPIRADHNGVFNRAATPPSEAKAPMKPMGTNWKIGVMVFAAIAAIFIVTTYWPAIRFSYELQQAMDKQAIEKVMVVRCPGARGMFTYPNKEEDLKFHQGIENLGETPGDLGACYKSDFGGFSSKALKNGNTRLTAENISEARNTLGLSYFVRSGFSGTIISDAIFFYEPAEHRIYAIYYWQTRRHVSLAILDDSSEYVPPIVRSGLWPNKFTDALYVKFILEKAPQ